MLTKHVIHSDSRPLQLEYFRELVAYRDLLLVLAYKEYRVRYAQTFLGFVWAFLQPALTLVVLTAVFDRVVHVDTGGVPYPLSVITAIAIWSYFSFVVMQAGRSLLQDQNMVQKVYFPRVILPLSKALVGLVDLGISLGLLSLIMVWYGFVPGRSVLFLPLFIALAVLWSLACGIWISALTVRFRDVQHVIPFVVQFGLYATPVAYTVAIVPPRYRSAYLLINPLAGIVEGFRSSVIGHAIAWPYVAYSAGVTLALLVGGLVYFRRVEITMSDLI